MRKQGEMNRRDFFKAAGVGGVLTGVLGFDLCRTQAWANNASPVHGKITTTICPYCGCGCGALVTAVDGQVVNIEGDPDHPVNEGSLCSKGAAMYQIANNPRRLVKPKYRAPGATEWQEVEWDWTIKEIAKRIKATRDATFQETDEAGRTVNRTEAIACMGGAALDSEECYTYSKLSRAMGAVFIEHQARI